MELQIGSIVTGKVTGIAKFGAFVEIAPGQSGLVHISEIADAYVNEVRDHLAEGQQVQVKVISVDGKKINLSIKAAANTGQPVRVAMPERPPARTYQPRSVSASDTDGEVTFEDRLKRFMKDSDSKISEMRRSSDRRGGAKRRGK